MIPKVEFKIASLDQTFPFIHEMLNPKKGNWDWSNLIFWGYPSLKKKLEGTRKVEDRKKIEYEFLKKILKRDKIKMERKKIIFQKEWNKVNDKVMIALSELVEDKLVQKDKKIIAFISLNTICPRDIIHHNFEIFYRDSIRRMKSTAIHELLHFIYFNKWKKIFPKTKKKDFDQGLIWELSEMVVPIILNDKKIQRIFKYKFHSYSEYENAKIKGKPLLLYLQIIYNKRENFEDFLKKSWSFINKHKKEIKKI